MREPPKGPIKWTRRRLLPGAARLLAWSGVLLLVAFGVGRVLTDRFHWSQYLWWLPAEWVLAGAWALLIASSVLALGSTRLGGAFVRPFLLVGVVVATAWVGVAEWHAERFVVPVRAHGATVRVAHWNLSANELTSDPSAFIAGHHPDVAVIVNARYDDEREALIDGLRALAGADESGGVRFLQRGRVMIASKLPIVGFGVAPLEKLSASTDWPSARDSGQVAFVELDASAEFPSLGRPMVVWIADLPSDPSLWRVDLMRAARRAVDGWDGTAWRVNDTGTMTPTKVEGGFPEPDVVVGDFNTPRGSASVRALVGGMTGAHEAAGRGRDASFRVRFRAFSPGLQIDLAFVGDGWRAAGYDLARWSTIKHAMQWVDVERE